MNHKRLLLLPLFLLAVAALLWIGSRGNDLQADPPQADDRLPSIHSIDIGETPTTNSAQRAPIPGETPRSRPALPPIPSPQQFPILGRVVDGEKKPLPGVRLVWLPEGEGETLFADSDWDGSFRILAPQEKGSLELRDSRYVLVGRNQEGETLLGYPHTLVAVPKILISGAVRSSRGVSIEGAAALVFLDVSAFANFEIKVEKALLEKEAKTDSQGHFDFAEFPGMQGASLSVSKPGFEAASLPIPLDAADSIEIVLRPAELRTLQGVAVDAVGQPIAQAKVDLGFFLHDETDAEGKFSIHLSRGLSGNTPLVISKPGYETKTIERFGERLRGSAPPEPVRVTLAENLDSIQGRVIDSLGAPIPGCIVFAQPQQTGKIVGAASAMQRLRDRVDEVRTGAEGSFVFSRLRPGNFRMLARDPNTLAWAAVGPVPTNVTGVTIELRSDAVLPAVSGLVVDASGAPIPGLHVRASLQVESSPLWQRDSVTQTNERGRFVLRGVARQGVSLLISGPSILSQRHKFPESWNAEEELRIQVPRKCGFRIVLESSRFSYTSFSVLDGEGETMGLLYSVAALDSAPMDQGVLGGVGEVVFFETGENARFLAIQDLQGAKLLKKVDLSPQPGKIVEIVLE